MRINPFTGEPLRAFESTDAKAQVAALHERQISWGAVSMEERCRILEESLSYFESHRDQIAKDITTEMGRPLAQARGEIDGLMERGRYLASIAPSILQPELVDDKEGFDRAILHEPLGVVFIISAWNYPLLITINGVMASLLAGNTVLLKHATQTLAIGAHFAEAFGDLVQHAVMDHETAAELMEKRAVDHVIFTGSVEAGRTVYQSAARGLLDCQLELGGKDGAYVAADADVQKAAETLVDGAIYNSGQSCCGVERVYAHADMHDAFVAKCQENIRGYVLGDPSESDTNLGPLADAGNVAVMEAHISDALKKGAQLVCGGEMEKIGNGTFFQPTLLTEVTHEMTIMQEENFGPILPVMKVSDDEEAIRLINDSDYGLTSIIFTADKKRAEWFCNLAKTGTVFMNRCDYLDPALPWTGVKDSGVGSALSKYGLLGVTRRKAKHFRLD
ncbi:MAG: acyl-CoA reductase-like NAD-dependent aldehyde dehydrogenase [Verrucomicrobiales bacterium]|jgi:acyl-CoA reductase-like NAD-dependent aldehyde dehydrogenase